MFVMIGLVKKEQIVPGDPVILKYDSQFGRVGAFGIDGRLYGYMTDATPEGCLSEWWVCSRISDRRIIAKAAVVWDNGLLLQTDNQALAAPLEYVRVEKAGYGMLVCR